jgi:hypothetical protein
MQIYFRRVAASSNNAFEADAPRQRSAQRERSKHHKGAADTAPGPVGAAEHRSHFGMKRAAV